MKRGDNFLTPRASRSLAVSDSVSRPMRRLIVIVMVKDIKYLLGAHQSHLLDLSRSLTQVSNVLAKLAPYDPIGSCLRALSGSQAY
jgi:hypothetical protein